MHDSIRGKSRDSIEEGVAALTAYLERLEGIANMPGHTAPRHGLPPSLTRIIDGKPRFRTYLDLTARDVDTIIAFTSKNKSLLSHHREGSRSERLANALSAYRCRIFYQALALGSRNGEDLPDLCLEMEVLDSAYPLFEKTADLQALYPPLGDNKFQALAGPILLSYIQCGFNVLKDLERWAQLPAAKKEAVAEAAWAVASLAHSRELLDLFCEKQPELIPLLGKCSSAFLHALSQLDTPDKIPSWSEAVEALIKEARAVRQEAPDDGLSRLLVVFETVKQAAAAEVEKLEHNIFERRSDTLRKICRAVADHAETMAWFAPFKGDLILSWGACTDTSDLSPEEFERLINGKILAASSHAQSLTALVAKNAQAEKELTTVEESLSATADWKIRLELTEKAGKLSTVIANLKIRIRETEALFLKTISPEALHVSSLATEEKAPAPEAPASILDEIDEDLLLPLATPEASPAPRPPRERPLPGKAKPAFHVVKTPEEPKAEPVPAPVVAPQPTLLPLGIKELTVKAIAAPPAERPRLWANLSLAALAEEPAAAWHAARVAKDLGYPAAGSHHLQFYALTMLGAPTSRVIAASQDAFLAGPEDFFQSPEAAGLLTLAAAAPTLLTAGHGDLVDILAAAELPDGLPRVHSLREELLQLARSGMSFSGEMAELLRDLDTENGALAASRATLEDLLHEKHYATTSYVPAKRLMITWLDPKRGLVGARVKELLSGSFDPDKMAAFAANMLDDSYVEHHMDRTVRELLSGKGQVVERHARRDVVVYCQEVGEAVLRHLELLETIAAAPRFVTDLHARREALLELSRQAAAEIREFPAQAAEGDPALIAAAVAAACGKALSLLPAIMAGEPVKGSGALNWRAPGLAVDEGMPSAVVLQLVEAAVKGAGGYWKKG